MNCTNCGAVLELVESQRYFKCAHCGAFNFPQAEAEGADGIRILGKTADAPPCPLCSDPLAQAVIDDKHPVHFCVKCRGVLLPRQTFAGVVQRRRAWATDPPAIQVPLDRRALERRVSCPRCHQRFDTYPHYGPGNVVIDNCPRCDVVWLDFGEIRQIVDAPGRDRGGRQVVPMDDDYVRYGASEAEEDDAPQRRSALGFLFDLFSG
jgi:Zn-finger nucleic acid-binding protein